MVSSNAGRSQRGRPDGPERADDSVRPAHSAFPGGGRTGSVAGGHAAAPVDRPAGRGSDEPGADVEAGERGLGSDAGAEAGTGVGSGTDAGTHADAGATFSTGRGTDAGTHADADATFGADAEAEAEFGAGRRRPGRGREPDARGSRGGGRRGRDRGERGRGERGRGGPGDPELDPDADPESVARTVALNRLSTAPQTRAQLDAAMARKGVPEEVRDGVLDRFADVGLVDDAAYARAWVESRHTGRGLARRALGYELRKRGVEPAIADDAVETLDPEQEEATARALVAARLASTRRFDPVARTRRLTGLLARKGYPPGLAFRVVREALESDGVDGMDLPDDFLAD